MFTYFFVPPVLFTTSFYMCETNRLQWSCLRITKVRCRVDNRAALVPSVLHHNDEAGLVNHTLRTRYPDSGHYCAFLHLLRRVHVCRNAGVPRFARMHCFQVFTSHFQPAIFMFVLVDTCKDAWLGCCIESISPKFSGLAFMLVQTLAYLASSPKERWVTFVQELYALSKCDFESCHTRWNHSCIYQKLIRASAVDREPESCDKPIDWRSATSPRDLSAGL